MDKKLVVVIMGQNCEKFIGMCLESVKDADAIVYCDGGSTDKTLNILTSWDFSTLTKEKNKIIIENKWNSEDKAMNGKQRNFYLKYLKENYPNDWCLCLDADEVVENLSKIKEFIQLANEGIYSVKMRHFIGNLGWEDVTHQVHFVPNRLFKISEAESYPLHSHPVLQGNEIGPCTITTIWHLGHLPVEYMKYIVKRYNQHCNDSLIHPSEFLKWWRNAHLFGQYPVKQIDPNEIPDVILKEFEIDKDEIYFSNRGLLETKHFVMVKNWLEVIEDFLNPVEILDIGCGMGHYGYVAKEFFNCIYKGIDKSNYAVKKTPYKDLDLEEGDVTKDLNINKSYDLVLCIDILEHLNYKDLNKALENISISGKKFIFSIPFKGDPNLNADVSHIIKEEKGWWTKTLSKYFIIKDAPSHWAFANQMLIGEKK